MRGEEGKKGEEIQLVAFRVGREEYGLDIQEVKEIIKMQEITEIPNAPEGVEGVINLRGQITPVMDMRKKLNAERKNNRDTRIVIVENKGENMGIIVDAVTGVIQIPEESISPPPAVGNTNEFVKGVGKVDGRLLILIDIKKMMPDNTT